MTESLTDEIRKHYSDLEYDSPTEKLLMKKIEFVAKHWKDIIKSPDTFYVTDIYCLPELSSDIIKIHGIDDNNLAYSGSIISVFIDKEEEITDDILNEYDSIVCKSFPDAKNMELYYYAVLN